MAEGGGEGLEKSSAVERLREVSPWLYRGVIAALGLAAALSLFRSFSSGASYRELFIFVAVLVVLLSVVIVLERLFRTESGRLVTASFVLIAAAGTYSAGVVREGLSGPSAPTVEARTTFCRWMPWLFFCADLSAAAGGGVSIPAGPATAAATAPPGPNLVWIQFAGTLDRQAQIIPLARSLEAAGWAVPAGARGGERIATAAGLSEIRFFYEEDRAKAERLAEAIRRSGMLPKEIAGRLRLVLFDAARFPGVKPGTLEVWIGD